MAGKVGPREYLTVDLTGQTARMVQRYAVIYELTISQAAEELINLGE